MIPGVSLGSRISAVEADRPVHLTSFSTLLFSTPCPAVLDLHKISGFPWFSPVRVGFPSFWVGFLRVSYMLNMYRIRLLLYRDYDDSATFSAILSFLCSCALVTALLLFPPNRVGP